MTAGFEFKLHGSVDGDTPEQAFEHLEAWLRAAPLPVGLSWVDIGEHEFDLQSFETTADKLVQSERWPEEGEDE